MFGGAHLQSPSGPSGGQRHLQLLHSLDPAGRAVARNTPSVADEPSYNVRRFAVQAAAHRYFPRRRPRMVVFCGPHPTQGSPFKVAFDLSTSQPLPRVSGLGANVWPGNADAVNFIGKKGKIQTSFLRTKPGDQQWSSNLNPYKCNTPRQAYAHVQALQKEVNSFKNLEAIWANSAPSSGDLQRIVTFFNIPEPFIQIIDGQKYLDPCKVSQYGFFLAAAYQYMVKFVTFEEPDYVELQNEPDQTMTNGIQPLSYWQLVRRVHGTSAKARTKRTQFPQVVDFKTGLSELGSLKGPILGPGTFAVSGADKFIQALLAADVKRFDPGTARAAYHASRQSPEALASIPRPRP